MGRNNTQRERNIPMSTKTEKKTVRSEKNNCVCRILHGNLIHTKITKR